MRFVGYIICCNCVSLCVCPGTDISATVTPIDVKVCMTVDLSSRQVFSFRSDIFMGRQLGGGVKFGQFVFDVASLACVINNC